MCLIITLKYIMTKSNTFARAWNNPIDTVKQKETSIHSQINDILFHLYWFNLWFAVEKSIDDVRDEVASALEKANWNYNWMVHAVASALTDEVIQTKVDKYANYKIWVEQRAENTPKIHD